MAMQVMVVFTCSFFFCDIFLLSGLQQILCDCAIHHSHFDHLFVKKNGKYLNNIWMNYSIVLFLASLYVLATLRTTWVYCNQSMLASSTSSNRVVKDNIMINEKKTKRIEILIWLLNKMRGFARRDEREMLPKLESALLLIAGCF